MKKPFQNQKVKYVWQVVKPWIVTASVLLFFHMTGILSSVSFLANTALLKTGLMDAQPEIVSNAKDFNYDFAVKDLQGNTVRMDSFKGKVVFINLWATWCGPCRVEMPSIQSLYDKVDKNQIAFVMLSLDKDENLGKVRNYVQDKKFTFPVYMPKGYLTDQLKVPSIPTTFIIGKDGKIKSKKVGTANYDTEKFQRFLEELVRE